MTDPQQQTSTHYCIDFANGMETETREPAIERRETPADDERERAAFDMKNVGERWDGMQ